jgi:hypothetical protein
LKIVALNGLLGYGYDRSALYKAFEEKVDYLGVDAGSVDPGPYYLGSGNSFTERGAVKRDLEDALLLAIKNKTPFIIGTAGGSGSMVHVNWLRDIVKEVAAKEGVLDGFSDADTISGYAREAIELLVSEGIITGANGRINPKGKATRAEIAVILQRVLQKAGQST